MGPSAAASCWQSATSSRCCFYLLQRQRNLPKNLALDAADRLWIPRQAHLAPERRRHYSALQGKNKSEFVEYGDEKFMTWRRSYDIPPPPLDLTLLAGKRPPLRGR